MLTLVKELLEPVGVPCEMQGSRLVARYRGALVLVAYPDAGGREVQWLTPAVCGCEPTDLKPQTESARKIADAVISYLLLRRD